LVHGFGGRMVDDTTYQRKRGNLSHMEFGKRVLFKQSNDAFILYAGYAVPARATDE